MGDPLSLTITLGDNKNTCSQLQDLHKSNHIPASPQWLYLPSQQAFYEYCCNGLNRLERSQSALYGSSMLILLTT